MGSRPVRVLIAGAGLGGLALVRALRRPGVSIDVVERASAFGPLGVGIVLHPNGMRVLTRMGLAEEVRAAGNRLRVMGIVRGHATLQLPLAEVWGEADQPTVAILRPALHEILIRGLFDEEGGARLRMGQAVAGVDSIASGPRALFADGEQRSLRPPGGRGQGLVRGAARDRTGRGAALDRPPVLAVRGPSRDRSGPRHVADLRAAGGVVRVHPGRRREGALLRAAPHRRDPLRSRRPGRPTSAPCSRPGTRTWPRPSRRAAERSMSASP